MKIHKTEQAVKHLPFRKGSALIAIFWLMSILAMAVFASIAIVKVQADVVTAESHGKRARELAEKGVALAAHPLIKRSDPLLQYEDVSEGYSATFEPMATTFGINALVNQMIVEMQQPDIVSITDTFLGLLLTREWGMDESEADLFLSCLAEWVDPDDQVSTANGWEDRNYELDGFTGRPFNRFFKSLDEVQLVHGYAYLDAIKPDWRDYFNIWTADRIDLSSADPDIISLASLSINGRLISIEEAQMIYDQVIGEDGIRDTEDDLINGNIQQLLTTNTLNDPSQLFNRYTFEGNQPQFFTIESSGWSGKVYLTIKMSLQGRGNSPQLLEREEIIEYSENE